MSWHFFRRSAALRTIWMHFTLVVVTIIISQLILSTSSLSINPKKMFAAFGQFASSSQFYLFGRNRCTRTGWEKASKAYPKPDILQEGRKSTIDLSDRVFMVTGANGGIGFEISSFLALKNATVYMVCRSAERGNAARNAIVAESKNEKVHLLLGDCGLEKDVRRFWAEFESHRLSMASSVQLDALVCNAGALLNELTLTEEDVEVTFAAHLLFGTYLMGNLAMPTLKATPNSRLIAVSSGGMYNSKFPSWDVATSTGNAKYDGQFAYVYAKRGQVLLCEEWAKQHGDAVKIVSCHPGWVDTGGVDKAYGENKKYLEPLRSLWEGAEGIIWLCIAPTEQIEGGAFYLDRTPQVKHLAGPFFTEGSFTKNTPEEVAEMMTNLHKWSVGDRPSHQQSMIKAAQHRPLEAMDVPIDLVSFMGNWYVLANIPTTFETGATNCIEMYELDPKRPNTVRVTFEYSFASATKEHSFSTSQMKMRGNVKNTATNTFWTIDPKIIGWALPLGLSYLILDVAEDYSYTLVSVPDRSYLWVMIRDIPSEFPPANVKVVDAYPELRKDGFGSSITGTAADKTMVTGEAAKTCASGDLSGVKSGSQLSDNAQAAATDGDKALLAAGAVDQSVQQTKRHYEIQVLQRALAKAEELGFDVQKVLRCPWHVQLEKKKSGEKAELAAGAVEKDNGESNETK